MCYTSNYRERYADEINRRFGAPDGPVLKDGQHMLTYAVRQAVITPETLFWLSSISSDQGIRIIGPGELRGAVGMYYEKMSRTIMRPLPKNMAAQSKTKGK